MLKKYKIMDKALQVGAPVIDNDLGGARIQEGCGFLWLVMLSLQRNVFVQAKFAYQ